MLGNKEKDKIVKRYGNYYWEQIKKLSESYYKDLEERVREIEEKDQRIAELEQELAKKDETIEDIKDHQKDLCLRCGVLTHKQYAQDKISFAVEQLEKVKEFYNTTDKTVYYEYCPDGYDTAIIKDDLLFNIDNQIAELKKGGGIV